MVTGGTGMAGSHTVRSFLEAGHAVRLLVRDADKVKRVFGPELAVEGQTLEMDVLGRTHAVSVVGESPYDPDNLRLRA